MAQTVVNTSPIDKDRVWNVRDLPAGARVKVQTKEIIDWKEVIKDSVAIFIYMDWAYWRWKREEDDAPLIFRWQFKQISENDFIFYEPKEWQD